MGKPDMELVKDKPTEKMIRKENLTDLLRKPRDLAGPQSGFGSKLPRHEAKHDQRYFGTTYGGFFGKPLQASAKQIVQEFQKTMTLVAGADVPPPTKEHRTLVGETLRKSTLRSLSH